MMPSSTIPASSGRVQAAHGCLRRTVLEGVQRAFWFGRRPGRCLATVLFEMPQKKEMSLLVSQFGFAFHFRVPGTRDRIMKGAYRSATRVALQEAAQARSEGSEFLVVLGTPLGHADFVRSHLESVHEEQDVLLDRIPVPNLQAAWLLLSYCAATRANFVLRTVRRWQ